MSTPHQHERTHERRNALQVLYQSELLGQAPSTLIEQDRLADETRYMGSYATAMLKGIEDELGVVDDCIEEASDNWTLERMPLVDLSLLRLSTYEMLFSDDVPVSVSINEAVNLAKEFGGNDSPRFINGILGRIATALEEDSDGKFARIKKAHLQIAQPIEAAAPQADQTADSHDAAPAQNAAAQEHGAKDGEQA